MAAISALVPYSAPDRVLPTPLSTIAPALFCLRPSLGSYLFHPWSRASMQSSRGEKAPKACLSAHYLSFSSVSMAVVEG